MVLSAGLSERDYDAPAQAKVRSYADAAVSRNQNVPASWEVRESSPFDEANELEEVCLKNEFVKNNSAENGMQQKLIRSIGECSLGWDSEVTTQFHVLYVIVYFCR